VPIPGTTKVHRLEENLGSLAINLSPVDLGRIGDALAQIAVHGERYPPSMQRMVGR
jgi:aryl-alcohol dehydrogenase-like predicted oxidoreductase